MNKYIYHLASSVRRKRSSALIIALGLILIIFGLNYKRNGKTIRDQISPNMLREFKDSNRVNFLNTNRSNQVEKANNNLLDTRFLNKDENFLNDLNSFKDTAQIETEQQLGIPFVNSFNKNPYIPEKRLVHLDLKGAPPLLSYYQRFFPFIRNLGATGILIGEIWNISFLKLNY